MKSKTVFLMGVGVGMGLAIVCGLAANSYMTSRLLAQKQASQPNAKKEAKKPAAEKAAKVFVFKAKHACWKWFVVRDPAKVFEPVAVKKTEAPKDFIAAWDPKNPPAAEEIAEIYDSLRYRSFLKKLKKGDILTQTDLQSADKCALENSLPYGKRAVSVAITPEHAVAGHILPGSHVDVLVTRRLSDKRPIYAVQYILQNILVRAIDLKLIRPADKPGIVGSVITLELTPKQIKKFLVMKASGTITFALRPYGDITRLEESQDAPPPPPPPRPDR